MADPEGKLVTPVGFNGNGYPRAADMFFGFNEHFGEENTVTSAAAGTNSYTIYTVPAGEIVVVTALYMHDWDNAPSAMQMILGIGGVDCLVRADFSTERITTLDWSGWVVLTEGDYIHFDFFGVTAGDTLHMGAMGFRMTT